MFEQLNSTAHKDLFRSQCKHGKPVSLSNFKHGICFSILYLVSFLFLFQREAHLHLLIGTLAQS